MFYYNPIYPLTNMSLFLAHLHLFIFLSLIATANAIAKYAKPGCSDTCGNVTIPYPFGIGADCSVNEWYIVDCNYSTPYLSALKQLEVLGVNLEDQTIIINTPTIIYCHNHSWFGSKTKSIDLVRSPFLFSKSHNMFVSEGCGNAVMMDNKRVVTGCSTYCQNEIFSERNNCYGINCCQATIPHYLQSYNMNLTSVDGDGDCAYAFLVDEDSYIKGRLSVDAHNVSVPVTLMWTLTSNDTPYCCQRAYLVNLELDTGNGTSMESRGCFLDGRYEGNPYLYDGCEDREECARCPYSCDYTIMYLVHGLIKFSNLTCSQNPVRYESKSSSLGITLGVTLSMGILFLVATSYTLYKWIKKARERSQRKRFFKRNGGLLLKQQEEADPSLVGKTVLFTSHELEKATDNFNENRILGRGGQGTVYKGMLVDGRIVAIKKSTVVDGSRLEQFINEVIILSQVNHRNVVKLFGYCLETNVPLLVSEFITNGTLYDCLHNDTKEFPLSLDMRIRIATEVAGALAYLHSATSIPIYHRDIKTTNILLDDKYRAKVSDFGTSRFVSIEQTHLTTLVKGTFGYLDPEYFQSSHFTEKSDVYSFGVVLVELLTGEKPIFVNRFGEHISLATHFMLAFEEGHVMSIFYTMVVKEGASDELMLLANLAMRCLNLNKKYRPTMKEVAIELGMIRTSQIPFTNRTNTCSSQTGRSLDANIWQTCS